MGLHIPMTEVRAREILGDRIRPDGWLTGSDDRGFCSLQWKPGDQKAACFDTFSADELEALAWWMRNKAGAR